MKPKGIRTEKVVFNYLSGLSMTEVASEMGVSVRTITHHLDKAKIQRRPTNSHSLRTLDLISQGVRKYKLNEEAFDNISREDVQYFLGLIVADGNVHMNRVTLVLHENDRESLERFRDFLGTDRPIVNATGAALRMVVASDRLCERLAELGIYPNKSLTIRAHDSLIDSRHFWRGCIDGDGSIGWNKKKYNVYPQVQFCSGSEALVRQYVQFLQFNIGISPSITTAPNLYSVNVSCSNGALLARFLYENSKVSMKRKFEEARKLAAWIPKDYRDVRG